MFDSVGRSCQQDIRRVVFRKRIARILNRNFTFLAGAIRMVREPLTSKKYPPAAPMLSRAESSISTSGGKGVGVGLGVDVGRGVGVARGSLVGSGILDAETGPATGVLVGGTAVGVPVGALVGVGVGTGSCPQATASTIVSATKRVASVGFMRDDLLGGIS